jgi:hypothetical protein
MATIPCPSPNNGGMTAYGDVVEISLLLPAKWADALVELSKQRRQSVGQILRRLIDRALSEDELLRN